MLCSIQFAGFYRDASKQAGKLLGDFVVGDLLFFCKKFPEIFGCGFCLVAEVKDRVFVFIDGGFKLWKGIRQFIGDSEIFGIVFLRKGEVFIGCSIYTLR